jgi:putative ABC transport system substrate-binding protein
MPTRPWQSENAAAFVAERVDVIVAFSGSSAQAAHYATSTIPIVMDMDDPIRSGLVASLARPGGNRDRDFGHV